MSVLQNLSRRLRLARRRGRNHAIERLPTMRSSLEVLLAAGVDIGCVLDVGVLTGTRSLIDVFPSVPHHLFEPAAHIHRPEIEKAYRHIDHTLHEVAVSNADDSAYLQCRSVHFDQNVTHADVVDRPVTAEEIPGLVSCVKIERVKLDTIMAIQAAKQPYLLKIDTDGHEMAVLEGASKTMESTAIVVIEAPVNRSDVPHFFQRADYLRGQGFLLMDIVDHAYYDGVLWQVDLVFVSKHVVAEHDRLRPFESKAFTFRPDRWFTLGEH